MLDEKSLGALRRGFGGSLILPGSAEYDEARKVFNAMIDKRPAVIARCASTADVVAAVNFGRERKLEIAVRSGGHSVAGLSIGNGILIDLAGLKSIDIDINARIARAGGGVLWGEYDKATQAHGLHTPGGRVTTTGVGGFTTGGGYGWTSSKYALTCDNLVSAEVVLADGRVLTASASENADLFWGIRGGGGNFGVVTRFDLRLHPLGPTVLAGLAMWPIERGGEVLRAWRDLADGAPDELSMSAVVVTAPREEFVPDALKGKPVVGVAAIYVGDPQAGVPVVAPIKALRPPIDLIQPMPYTAFQAIIDPLAPTGKRNYWRGEYMASFSDEAIDTFLQQATPLTTAGAPLSQMVMFRIGQAVSRVPDDATAFSHRDARYLFHPILVWDDPANDAKLMSMGRAFAEAMRRFGTGGAYLNFTPESDRVRDAFSASKYERLAALKHKYDPQNLFRGNQNIKPARPQPPAQAPRPTPHR